MHFLTVLSPSEPAGGGEAHAGRRRWEWPWSDGRELRRWPSAHPREELQQEQNSRCMEPLLQVPVCSELQHQHVHTHQTNPTFLAQCLLNRSELKEKQRRSGTGARRGWPAVSWAGSLDAQAKWSSIPMGEMPILAEMSSRPILFLFSSHRWRRSGGPAAASLPRVAELRPYRGRPWAVARVPGLHGQPRAGGGAGAWPPWPASARGHRHGRHQGGRRGGSSSGGAAAAGACASCMETGCLPPTPKQRFLGSSLRV